MLLEPLLSPPRQPPDARRAAGEACRYNSDAASSSRSFPSITHHTTFILMDASGRSAGRASAGTGWRLEKAEIVCVILQGSLPSLCKAAMSCCVLLVIDLCLCGNTDVTPVADHDRKSRQLKILCKFVIFDPRKSLIFSGLQAPLTRSVCTLSLCEPAPSVRTCSPQAPLQASGATSTRT